MKYQLEEGQKVYYNGKETNIEAIYPNNYYLIANPDLELDVDGEYVFNGIDYTFCRWIIAHGSELEPYKCEGLLDLLLNNSDND